MQVIVINNNNMGYYNNATAIIRHWKDMYNKTKNAYFARCVFEATGEYPDDLVSWGIDMTEQYTNTELEMIDERINNDNLPY